MFFLFDMILTVSNGFCRCLIIVYCCSHCGCYVLGPCFVMQYFFPLSISLVLQLSCRGRESYCFTFIVFLMLCVCYCSLPLFILPWDRLQCVTSPGHTHSFLSISAVL